MERYTMKEILRHSPMELANYPDAQDDKELVMLAVQNDEMALQYASDRLLHDPEFLLLSIASGVDVRYVLPEDILCNKEIMIQLVGQDASLLADASDELTKDKEIALAAMKAPYSSWGYRELPAELAEDADVLRVFIEHLDYDDADALDSCSRLPNELLNDDDFIRTILNIYEEYIINLTGCGLWNNKAFVLRAIQLGGDCLEYISENLQNDPDVQAALDAFTGESWDE